MRRINLPFRLLNSLRILLLVSPWIFCAVLVVPAVSFSLTESEMEAAPAADVAQNTAVFTYQMEGRPDPFVPFITEKAAASNVDMDEIVDANGPLTGMQLFEPGQLTLVAVMQSSSGDVAMVEDFTGKGYVLSEGIKIGRRGIIKDIVPNAVIIEETAVTRAGKKIITETVMLLRKEGEE